MCGHQIMTFVNTMKKFLFFLFVYGLSNYCSAQSVYQAPKECMELPTDLVTLIRGVFLEGFIEVKKDIAKITAAQNLKLDSLRGKYFDQKDNITDLRLTLETLLGGQEWMLSNISELYTKMRGVRHVTSVIRQQVSKQHNDTAETLGRLFEESLRNVTNEYSEGLRNIKQNVTRFFELVFNQTEAAFTLNEEIGKYALTMERLQVEINELKENISLSKDTPSSPVTCHVGWAMFGTSCYMAVHQQLSWINASMKCLTSGSKLVEIETKAENDFLKSSLVANEGNYWTGGKDDVTEGRWVWVSSGATFDFLDWNTGEPNNVGEGEDCLEFFKQTNHENSWNDNSCEKSFNFICEKVL